MKYHILLEGGGAKGIGHLGVIQAIIHYRLDLSNKLAGTSAGALVALLFATGYNPEEILSSDVNNSLIPKRPFDLVQPSYFKRFFLLFYFLIVVLSLILIPFMFNFGFENLSFIVISLLSYFIYKISKKVISKKLRWFRLTLRMASGIFLFIPITIYLTLLITLCFPLFWRFGLFDSENVEKWLRKSVSKKLKKEEDENYKITFRKFKSITGYSLSIIATNLSTRQLQLFSDVETPDIDVIDATIASISLPLFFKYKEIKLNGESQAFVDGGVVSNYPAWIHSGRTFLADFHQTIGVRFVQGINVSPYLDSPWSYLKTFFLSTLWGGQRIETSSLYGLQNVYIQPKNVSTLSFNCSEKLLALKTDSEKQATKYFHSHFSIFSQFDISNWQKGFVIQPIRRIFSEVLGVDIKLNKIRSALLGYIHEEKKISKLIYSYNMENNLDKYLEFDEDEGFVSTTLARGIAFFANIKETKYKSYPHLSNKERHKIPDKIFLKGAKKLVNSNVGLLLIVPIYDYIDVQEKKFNYWDLKEIRDDGGVKVKSAIGVDLLIDTQTGGKITDKEAEIIYEKLCESPETLNAVLNSLSESWSKSLTQLSRDELSDK